MSRIFGVFLLSLSILFASAMTAQAGTIVADSGFRPKTDGFSFENYGNEDGFANLDANEMIKMYGREVCLSPRGKCVLDPGIRNYMEYLNESMDGGHCFGLAALSELIHAGRLPEFGFDSIRAFGAGATTYKLSAKSKLLQKSIARAWAFQVYPAVYENIVEDTPVKVLQVLRRKLNPSSRESWNISIRRRDGQGGHAITPYAIEDMGDGISHVHVYDNNWPGNSNRRLIVDRNANTWSYYGATSPGFEQAKYEGDADTKSFRLKPIDPALGVQPCLQCTGRKGEKLKRNAITLSSPSVRHSRLLLEDDKGRRSGFFKGRTVNQIPGVQIVRHDTGIRFAAAGSSKPILSSEEPIYMVPKDLPLKIRVIGRKNRPVGLESVSVAGPSFDAAVEQLRATKTRPVWIRFNPKSGVLKTQRIGLSRELSARIGARSKHATFQAGIRFKGLPASSNLRLIRQGKRNVLMAKLSSPAKVQNLTASVTRFNTKGRARFAGQLQLSRGLLAEVRYGQMPKGGSAWLVILKPDGTVVARQRLVKVDDD